MVDKWLLLRSSTFTHILCNTDYVDKALGTKNITLAIDEDLLQKARVLAAMKRSSVNEMVREYLAREVEAETRQASRAQVWGDLFKEADNYVPGRKLRKEGERLFDREEFYEEVMRERGLL